MQNKGLFSACAPLHSEICKGELHAKWLVAWIQNIVLLIIPADSYFTLLHTQGWTFFFPTLEINLLHRKPAGCRHELCVKRNLHQNYFSDTDFYSELNTVWNNFKKEEDPVCSGVVIHFPPFGRTTVEEQRGCFRWGNLTFRALLVRGWREKKWVYTLVVLRGSTVPHFIWAHPANAHIGGPEQLGRRRDGEW